MARNPREFNASNAQLFKSGAAVAWILMSALFASIHCFAWEEHLTDEVYWYQHGTAQELYDIGMSVRMVQLASRLAPSNKAYKLTARRLQHKIAHPKDKPQKLFQATIKMADMEEEDTIMWRESVPWPSVKSFLLSNNLNGLNHEQEILDALRRYEADNGGRPFNTNPPALRPPPELMDRYLLNGEVKFEVDYRDESQPEAYPPYSKMDIDIMIQEAAAGACGYYQWTDTYVVTALSTIGELHGKSVAIMGSLVPWYEAVALAHGAAHVLTIEYNELQYNHPNITTVTNDEWYGDGGGDSKGTTFDVVLSISSFEHDGLGRYGDPLDPEGDIKAMQKMKRLVRPGGHLLLAVPTGKDTLVWNVHRIYGRLRLPLMMKGWTLEHHVGLDRESLDFYRGHGIQPVYILRNEDTGQVPQF